MNTSAITKNPVLFTFLLGAVLLVMTPGILQAQSVKVEVADLGGKYQLLRNGEPYIVKGVGLADGDLERLAAHGGNSIRTWSTVDGPEGTIRLLDQAQALGITVSLCVYTKSERHGFDYDNQEEVTAQFNRIRQEVLKYKDHPALLTWIIGNELNFDYKNPNVWNAVNDLSLMIHELDANHPTTTTLAGLSEDLVKLIGKRAPDLDFLSFQLYGQLYDLPGFIEDTDFSAPYFITEWGAIGHWEVPKTSWGAPLEQTSSEKADTYLRGYRKTIEPFGDQIIGNYVFLWGQKQEKTPTWYGVFAETGEDTEVVDVLHYIWNGSRPENRTPRIKSIQLDGRSAGDNIRLKAGEHYRARVRIKEFDDDPVSYLWQVKKESDAKQMGGDYEEAIAILEGQIVDPVSPEARLIAPTMPGPYRLFVYVYDHQGHAAHANVPFYVDE